MNVLTPPGHPRQRLRIGIAYFCVFFFWGSTYFAIRIGVETLPPAVLAGFRFLLASALLLSAAAIRKLPWPSWADIRTLSIVGIFLFVGGNGLVAWSEQWVPSGLAALIVASTPLFMSSLDALIPGGHRLHGVGWLGIAIGFVGVALLVLPGSSTAGNGEIPLTGVLGLAGASLAWSIGSIYSKRHPVSGHLIASVGIEMLAGGIVLICIAAVSGEFSRASFTLPGVVSVLYLVMMGSVVGFTAYMFLLRHVPAAKASTYAYVNPIIALLLGVVFLAEPFDGRMLLATSVVLGGVALVQLAQSRPR